MANYLLDIIEVLQGVWSGSTPPTPTTGKGIIYYDSTRQQLLKSENGAPFVSISGGNVVTQAAPYTVLTSDSIVLVTGTGNVTLPSAIGNSQLRLTIKNAGTGVVTVVPGVGGQTIDGSASVALPPMNAVSIVSNNVNWFIF